MLRLFAWRIVTPKDALGRWNEVSEEHFNHLRDSSFFGPGLGKGVYFEGRIITADNATIQVIDK